eukprot:TRINITY_DN72747_c0_g1_i1.p1 TRINITY_DN72747_c0_g1~~TRINITY_DN72747_c0_g1_i1.p1  ORF type:complete len:186 (-),score=12.11 TRINITY_DN72747_c0_g1_i1:265-822(-)
MSLSLAWLRLTNGVLLLASLAVLTVAVLSLAGYGQLPDAVQRGKGISALMTIVGVCGTGLSLLACCGINQGEGFRRSYLRPYFVILLIFYTLLLVVGVSAYWIQDGTDIDSIIDKACSRIPEPAPQWCGDRDKLIMRIKDNMQVILLTIACSGLLIVLNMLAAFSAASATANPAEGDTIELYQVS